MSKNSKEEAFFKEPYTNDYKLINLQEMNSFPFLLIGQITCEFNISKKAKYVKEGVGLLIGDDYVLTSANMFYYKDNENNIYKAKKISFQFLKNGRFEIFKIIECFHFSTNEKFYKYLNQDNFSKISKYDYGILFLPFKYGREILPYFINENSSKEDDIYLNFETSESGLFKFIENSIKEINSKENQFQSNKISLITYISRKESNYENAYSSYFNKKFKKLTNNDKNIFKLFSDSNLSFISKNQSYNSISHFTRKSQNLEISLNDKNSDKYINYDNLITPIAGKNMLRNLNINPKLAKTFVDYEWNENLKEEEHLNNFIVFNEEINNNLFFSDSDYCICESKTELYSIEKNYTKRYQLKYIMSTYKNQIGSPLFLRIKNNSKQEIYLFAGIHTGNNLKSTFDSRANNSNNYNKNINNVFNVSLKITIGILENIKTLINNKKSDLNFIFNTNCLFKRNNNIFNNYFLVNFKLTKEIKIIKGVFPLIFPLSCFSNILEEKVKIDSKYFIFFNKNNKIDLQDENYNYIKHELVDHDSNNLAVINLKVKIDVNEFCWDIKEKIYNLYKLNLVNLKKETKEKVLELNRLKIISDILKHLKVLEKISLKLINKLFKRSVDLIFNKEKLT